MGRRQEHPQPPRVAPPDLPAELGKAHGVRPRGDHFRVRITGIDGTADASHGDITESIVVAASVDRLDLAGATLVDVDIVEPRATSVIAREARLRRVRITGGRIGTLDLASAGLDEVELRGVRIDYLSLGAATVEDLIVADCTITTLDLPQATLSRVRFENSRADEVDTRGMRAESLDLRGLAAASFLDVGSLRGGTLTPWQVEQLAAAFAASVGIDVRD